MLAGLIVFSMLMMFGLLMGASGMYGKDIQMTIIGVILLLASVFALNYNIYIYKNNKYDMYYHDTMMKGLFEIKMIETDSGVELDRKSKDKIIEKYFEEEE